MASSNEVYKLLVTLDANIKDAIKGFTDVEDQGEETEGKLGAILKSMGNAAAAAGKAIAVGLAAGAAAVGALAVSAVKAYAEYEQATSAIETLFGQSADKIKQYADEAYKTAGLSATAYMNAVASFSANIVSAVGGDTERAAALADTAIQDMADNAAKMGTSLETLQGVYEGLTKQRFTQLGQLRLGYEGTAEGMARLINDSKVLGDQIEITADELNTVSFDKMVEAIHIVQTQMGLTGAAAEDSTKTIIGSLNATKAAWTNMMTSFATGDVKKIDEAIQGLTTSFGHFAENILNILPNVINGIIQMVQSLIPKLPGIIAQILPILLEGAEALIDAIIEIIPQIIEAIAEILPQIIRAIVRLLPKLIKTILDAITKLIPVIVQVVMDLVFEIIDMLPTLIPMLVDAVIGLVMAIVDMLPTLIPQLIDAVLKLAMAIIDAIPTILKKIIAVLGTIIRTVIDTLVAALPQLIDAVIQIVMAIVEALPEIIMLIIQAVDTIVDAIIDGLLDNLPALIAAAVQLLMGIIQAIPVIIQKIVELVPQIIEHFISRLTDEEQRGKLMEGAKTLFMGIVQAIPQILGALAQAVGSIIKTIVQNLFGGKKDVGDAAENGLFSGIFEGAKNIIGKVLGVFGNMKDSIGNIFSGIKDTASKVVDGVKNVASNIWGGIKNFFGFAEGGIMTEPTVFGRSGNNVLYGGEAGPEAILPLTKDVLGGIGQGIVAATSLPQGNNDQLLETLIEEVRALQDAQKQTQIVMDTGTLVGAIRKEIDKRLGGDKSLLTRGVSV